MICEKCGVKIPDNIKFCPKCGNRILENGTLTKTYIMMRNLWENSISL